MFLFSHHTIVPVRAEPSDASEMVTQLLFGELATLLSQQKQWMQVKCLGDGYEGWIDEKMVEKVSEEWVKGCGEWQYIPNWHLEAHRELDPVVHSLHLTTGARIPLGHCTNDLGYLHLQLPSQKILIPEEEIDSWHTAASPYEIARHYLGAPYLWGGKSVWGIDCSGLTQMVFRMAGISLPRDASQQVREGKEIAFEDQNTGDLAFFHNQKGKITHVGIIGPDCTILHASGRVRVDTLTTDGIKNIENERLTHFFHSIKRYT